VSADQPAQVVAATERLRAEKSVAGLLGVSARSFAELLGAPACTISRVIGDLLVDLIQHKEAGKPDRLGHGYLISDYPLTRTVVEEREPRTVFVEDPAADPNELQLLRELGFDSLLMVAIESGAVAWGLVEIYGDNGRRFSDEEVALARDLAGEVSDLLERLEQPEPPA
jgi:GAF domain-containing protein